MGSLTDYAENALLKHIATETAYSPAATVYLALCTADPTDAATGASMNEVANSNNYARTAITFGAAATRRVTQSGTVTFPTASGSWGTVSHWAVVTVNTYGSGNVLAHGAFAVAKSVVNGNTPSVASAEVYVEITASTGLTNYTANGFLDRMFRNQAFTVSSTYAALVTATPTDASTGSSITEPANGYARKQINTTGGASPAWSAVTGTAPTTLTNNQAVTFATPTGSWGTVTHWVLCDALTTGNALAYAALSQSQTPTTDDTVQMTASGGITITQT
jgi:hypothetical protein